MTPKKTFKKLVSESFIKISESEFNELRELYLKNNGRCFILADIKSQTYTILPLENIRTSISRNI